MVRLSKATLAILPLLAAFTACNVEEPKSVGYDVADMDATANPCTDFFTYAGGGWLANNPIPETEARWSKFNELADNNQQKIREIFKGLVDSQSDEKYVQVVRDMYLTGMDSTAAETMGLEPVKGLLESVENDQSVHDLITQFARARNIGVSSPFVYYVSADEVNSNINTMYLSQSGLHMPDKSYYLKDDSISMNFQMEFKKYIEKLLLLADPSNTQAADQANQIFKLEKQMAQYAMDRVDMREPENTYNPISYDSLKIKYPAIDWDVYFSVLNVTPSHMIINTPDYLSAITTMIADESLTSTWKLYNRFSVLNSFASYLNHDFVSASFDFYGKVLNGKKAMKPRWKRVLGDLNNGLSQEVGRIYVQKHFPESDKAKISEMVENLRKAYETRVSSLMWMSSETKAKALEKLKTFTYKVGYPDSWKPIDGLTILSKNYVGNLISLRDFRAKESLADYNKPVDKSRWGMGAHIVNAYYNPSNNEIVFPAGILQPPFYNPEADDALNYGGIGGVIGHEFTHGFDDQGSKYDAYGNLSEWWTEEDRAAFMVLAEKLAQQYDAYEPLPGVHVDGHLTLGENIADLGGLTLAYHAYKASHPNGGEEIDGFTPEQRIFLGWAQAFTGHSTDGYVRQQVVADPHSPAESRVLGPLSNIPEFYENFSCEVPGDLIIIW